MGRISICEFLMNRKKINTLLKWMVTGHEKWVTYDSVMRKRSRLNRKKRWPRQDCGSGKVCYDRQGINCLKLLLIFIQTYIVNSWTGWGKQSPRSGWLWPKWDELCCIRTTSGHTQRWWQNGAIWLELNDQNYAK